MRLRLCCRRGAACLHAQIACHGRRTDPGTCLCGSLITNQQCGACLAVCQDQPRQENVGRWHLHYALCVTSSCLLCACSQSADVLAKVTSCARRGHCRCSVLAQQPAFLHFKRSRTRHKRAFGIPWETLETMKQLDATTSQCCQYLTRPQTAAYMTANSSNTLPHWHLQKHS